MTRQRVCRLCGAPMPDQKPPYLIVDASGDIRGPLHSGCADKVVRGGAGKWTDYRGRTHRFGRLIPLDGQHPQKLPTVGPWSAERKP